VRNKKYKDKKDERKSTGETYRANFADEIQTPCSTVTNDDLVKRSEEEASARKAI